MGRGAAEGNAVRGVLMNWFLESPIGVTLLGGAIVAGLGIAYYQTRHRGLAIAIAAAVLLTAAAVTTERLVVTDYEQIEGTLRDITRALRAGDKPAVVAHIGDPEIRRRVEQYLGTYEFTEAGYGGLSVRMNHLMNPPTATAEFLGRVTVNFAGGERAGSVVRPMSVRFERQGDRWMLMQYEIRNFNEPSGGVP